MDGRIRGPAVLRGTFQNQGQTWAWFAFQRIEYLIRADLIVTVQPLEVDRP